MFSIEKSIYFIGDFFSSKIKMINCANREFKYFIGLICIILVIGTRAKAEDINVTKKVLIVYDRENYFGDERNAVKSIENLLFHFEVSVDKKNISEIVNLSGYDEVFIVLFESNSISQNIEKEIENFQGNIYWIGNIDEDLFKKEYGIKYIGKARNLVAINYKDKTYDIGIQREFNLIENLESIELLAEINDAKYKYPFIMRKDNFYYASRLDLNEPLIYIFADSLYEFFDIKPEPKRRILLNIQNVNPYTKVEPLKEQIIYLLERSIPFVISVNPFYKDENSSFQTPLAERPELVKLLKFVENQGGYLAIQGGTQQIKNGSFEGEDFFEWKKKNKGDEIDWVNEFIDKALIEMKISQLHPVAFDLSNYKLNQKSYEEIGIKFNFLIGNYSSVDWNINQSINPWVIKNKFNAEYILPNTFGTYDYANTNAIEDTNKRLDKVNVVRELEGSIGIYPEMGIKELEELLNYIETEKMAVIDFKDYDFLVKTEAYEFILNKGEKIDYVHNLKNEPLFKFSWRVFLYFFIGFLAIVATNFLKLFFTSKESTDRKLF